MGAHTQHASRSLAPTRSISHGPTSKFTIVGIEVWPFSKDGGVTIYFGPPICSHHGYCLQTERERQKDLHCALASSQKGRGSKRRCQHRYI